MRILPAAGPDASRLIAARSLRGFADGFASVLLAAHLEGLGFSPLEIGAIVTATLLGSALVTLAAGLWGGRLAPRVVLLAASALMLGTGAGFALLVDFWPLLLVGFVGTLNPTGGDVTVFLPTEQALLASAVAARERAALFARYNLGGALLGALGALASALPEAGAPALGLERADALALAFAAYGLFAVALALLYRGLAVEAAPRPPEPTRALARSRRVVLELSALFSLDSFGGGFVVQSLLALWLFRRFDFSLAEAGTFFFAAGVLSAFSQLASAALARRIGLVQTMVYTHLPANAFLVAAAFAPSAPLAIGLLLARMALSQMDVPARQAYVMSVVPPEERAAAASVTNVPRSLGGAASPLLAGALLDASSFGWPLVIGGLVKIAYDLLLLARFGRRPPEVG
jgi:MFS family permease